MPKTYSYKDISYDGQGWINDLRDCDGFPALDPAEMSAQDRDTLAAYLSDPDPSLSEADNEFSAAVADEITALDPVELSAADED